MDKSPKVSSNSEVEVKDNSFKMKLMYFSSHSLLV